MQFNRDFGRWFSIPRLGYTLAEVVITMLVIAVVFGISIKITKTKLNNITSYTYYSAYQTINSVTKEMLRDFDAEDEDYVSSIFNKLFLNPAGAEECLLKKNGKCYTYKTAPASDIVAYPYRPGDMPAERIAKYVKDVFGLESFSYFPMLTDAFQAYEKKYALTDNDCAYYKAQDECLNTSLYSNGQELESCAGVNFIFFYLDDLPEEPTPDPTPDPPTPPRSST